MQIQAIDRPSLPGAEAVARLVNVVTGTMFGVHFRVAGPTDVGRTEIFRAAELLLGGDRPLRVAVGADEQSCRALAVAFFGCAPAAADDSMIDDALRELANMAAGQIKSAVAPDEELTVPRIVAAGCFVRVEEGSEARDVVLHAREMALFLCITRKPKRK